MRQLSGFLELRGSLLLPVRLTSYPLSDTGEPHGGSQMFGRFAVEGNLCREFQNQNKITISHRMRRRAGSLADFPRKRPNLMEFRTGLQIYTSVVEYLNWRSGASWRPMSHRFRDERLGPLSAANTLNQAFNASPPGECACPYCRGSAFVIPTDEQITSSAALLTPGRRPAARRARA
jgi:hypothetical protein